jgi:DNA-directed RNA polymerase specialized sigma24 family protein
MLNTLATEYFKCRSEEAFNAIYRYVTSNWAHQITKDARSLNVPEPDMRALYEDALMDVIDKERDDFKSYLIQAIRNRKRDLRKHSLRKIRDYRREYLEHGLPELDDEKPGFQFADDYVLEEEAIARVQREREQSKIISALFNNTDDVICIKMLQAAKTIDDINTNSLGKAIGVTRKVIELRFKRLQDDFDRLDCGNIRDYLTA